jgi:hypothetical protein
MWRVAQEGDTLDRGMAARAARCPLVDLRGGGKMIKGRAHTGTCFGRMSLIIKVTSVHASIGPNAERSD